MPLVYRAHFALMNRPIFTSYGFNTSGLYGFTQTLLEILRTQQPTHLAVVFDTERPTQRHEAFPDYKVQRESMPEDLSRALPHVCRMIAAFNIPILRCDGYEADDVIGTLARQAERESYATYMVTMDKDFGQLVSSLTLLYKVSRMGDAVEILGPPEIKAKWGIERVDQVTDILALWGDASDNIPGVPGIGEKTASKLIAQYGSVENLLDHAGELKGKLRDNLETYRDQALLSKRLATIRCDAPCAVDLETLKLVPRDDDRLKKLFLEFEFNSIGRRLYGDAYKTPGLPASETPALPSPPASIPGALAAGESVSGDVSSQAATELGPEFELESEKTATPAPTVPNLRTILDTAHQYLSIDNRGQRSSLLRDLSASAGFACFVVAGSRARHAPHLLGLAFSFLPHQAAYVSLPESEHERAELLAEFAPVFANPAIEKIGHDLKSLLTLLQDAGVRVRGKLFDLMLAHSLIEPDRRHSLDHLAEIFLGYSVVPVGSLLEQVCQGRLNLSAVQPAQLADYGAESADLIWRLRPALDPLLAERKQERVFYEIEAPLIEVLADMEREGVKLDGPAMAEFAEQLQREMSEQEKTIHRLAGSEFNVNSPKQLGEVLFDLLKLAAKPKKTRTGQYATDEQTLAALAGDHPIVAHLLEYRICSKLKSTYADSLPSAVSGRTGRIHTTYHQAATSTGRLNSQDPNLQNIPIRSEQGREIRKAFIPRDAEHLLLSADYSQIELRIIAALSREAAMLEAFRTEIDIHTATAARVYGVRIEDVNSEMRRKAKMVNYGIAYGISAFGLAQRLGISRKEGAAIIEQYFVQFPGVREYMTQTVNFCREHGFVETIAGRRRYIREITSSNATIRGAAERNAINAPIQGTAADMIKIAMKNIHASIEEKNLRTRMLLQVHDELVFDLYKPEEAKVRELVADKMKNALPLGVPIVVEIGVGKNWLEAH